MPTNDICLVVADAARARFFLLEESEAPRAPLKLVERGALANPDLRSRGTSTTGRVRTETNTNRQAGPMHPIVAQRARHELELDRRFARQVAERAAELVAGWSIGSVILIAGPRMLGLLREEVHGALRPGLELKELAKDYTTLTTQELQRHLIVSGVFPASPAAG
ncbi:MAG: host attachment protein [Betaproteobacteria bacterium]|nr:host attachment protein [Betaproteobacteria bacterium]